MNIRCQAAWLLTILMLLTSLSGAQVGTNIEALPDTPEKVTDLWGNELRLYFDLPDNFLVFIDRGRNVQSQVAFGINERNDMMLAYLRACNVATASKQEQVDPGIVISLRGQKVAFKVANRDSRTWVVMYVESESGQEARFAVPQQWGLKDPRVLELMEIKQGFDRLLLKAAL